METDNQELVPNGGAGDEVTKTEVKQEDAFANFQLDVKTEPEHGIN